MRWGSLLASSCCIVFSFGLAKAQNVDPKDWQNYGPRVVFDPVTSEPVTFDPVTFDPVTFDPVTSDPVTFDPVTFDPVTFDAVTFDLVTFSGFDFTNFGDDDYPGGGQFDGLDLEYPTDLTSWSEWIGQAETAHRVDLQELAEDAGYVTLAAALGHWKQLVAWADDPNWVQGMLVPPSLAGYTGGVNYLGRWKQKRSMLKLAQIMRSYFLDEYQTSNDLPPSIENASSVTGRPRGRVTNWGQARIARGSVLAVVSGNVSHIGSPAGSGNRLPSDDYNSGRDSALTGSGQIIESPFFIVEGSASTNLGEGNTFGPITAPGAGTILSVNNAGVARTTVEKTFQLPAGQSNFSFQTLANFVTNEFPDFVGTQFDDRGSITLVTPAGQTFDLNTVFSESVNSSAFSPVSGLPSPLSDSGGQTGFESASAQIPVAPGGVVTLRIQVENVGDQLFPSAVLLNQPQAR